MEIGESHSLGCQFVNIRRFYNLIAIGSEIAKSQVIGQENHKIGAITRPFDDPATGCSCTRQDNTRGGHLLNECSPIDHKTAVVILPYPERVPGETFLTFLISCPLNSDLKPVSLLTPDLREI